MKMLRTLPGIAALIIVAPAFALAATGLTIQPVKISETLQPGASVSGTIRLTNASDSDVNVDVSIQDFVPVANSDTFQFVGRAPGVSSVRDWITLPTQSFKFKKGESRDIPYTITAPANAEPGGHFGAMFFKATQLTENGQSLKVGTQVGMLVLVAIPGSHTESGQILNFSVAPFLQRPPVPFIILFKNTGTVHFEPRGKIEIYNMLGKLAGEVPIEGEIVLPTTEKKMEFDWNPGGPAIGRYKAVATIVDGEGNTLTSASVTFWVVPVWYTLAFLAVLIIVFLILRFLKRRIKISVSVK
ncbi:MAG: hypothetical protein JO019_00850 [Candidatus Kaiserbacteria bacterium]|nr:hypothetical protein [Candidatus Kaiserbacteria bacterium]